MKDCKVNWDQTRGIAKSEGGGVIVLEMMNVGEVLACPVCGNDLSSQMICKFCNRKYSTREGVYILIDRETSGVEWKWDRRIISQKYRHDVLKGYETLISPDIREAHSLWWEVSMPVILEMGGLVVDLATGLGTMLEKILTRTEATVIATDIDPNVLLSTKRDFEKRISRHAFYLATDIKHMALKQNTIDHIVSFAGVNNITDPDLVMSELYRVLKPGATALLMASFIEEGSESADLAEDYGFIDAYIHDRFTGLINETGFDLLDETEASSVIWKENEMDIFPIDGDKVYYYTLKIGKRG